MTHVDVYSDGLDKAIEENLRINEDEASPLYSLRFSSRSASLTAEQTVALAKMLQQHHLTLGQVEFDRAALELESIKILSAALTTMPSLEIIKFVQCAVCDEGVKALANACVQMKALKEMSLYMTTIGVDGARALAEALSSGKWAVEKLELMDTGIGEEGAVALAVSMSYNTTLKELHLSPGNEIGREGAKSCVAALSLNSTLELLNLTLDDSGIFEAKALVDLFERSDSLRSLFISPAVPYHFEYTLKKKLDALNEYRSSPEWETHRILKKILQKQEEQGKKQEEQGAAIATLQGKVNQLMERDGDAEYVHIEASTRTDIGK